MSETLKNDFCMVEIRSEKKEFSGRDFTDQHNCPAFYNTRKRSFKKAYDALKTAWNDSMTMRQVMDILWDNGIACHSWCMMD
jgi:hypothetical protein